MKCKIFHDSCRGSPYAVIFASLESEVNKWLSTMPGIEIIQYIITVSPGNPEYGFPVLLITITILYKEK